MKLQEVQSERSFDYGYLYKRMYPFVKPYLFRGIMGIIIAIPAGALDGVMPYALNVYIDKIIPTKDFKLAIYLSIAIVLISGLQGVLRYLNTYLNDWSGRKITNDVKKYLFQKLVSFESSFYDQNSSGLILSRFAGDADAASTNLLNDFKTILTMFCSAIAYAGIMLYNSWQLAIVAITILGLSMLPVSLIKKKVKYISQEGMKVGSRITTNFNETFAGNKIIASYNLAGFQSKKFENEINEAFSLSMKLTKSVNWLSPIMYIISAMGFALVIAFSSYLIIVTHQLTLGKMTAFALSLILLYKPIKTIGNTLAGM